MNILYAVLCFLLGSFLGFGYFIGLKMTVQAAMKKRKKPLILGVSFFARLAAAAAGFLGIFWLSGMFGLLSALLGFTAARIIIVTREQRQEAKNFE
ncbi:MAG: ATP synthase subunit I [Spirochaetia bacterium]